MIPICNFPVLSLNLFASNEYIRASRWRAILGVNIQKQSRPQVEFNREFTIQYDLCNFTGLIYVGGIGSNNLYYTNSGNHLDFTNK